MYSSSNMRYGPGFFEGGLLKSRNVFFSIVIAPHVAPHLKKNNGQISVSLIQKTLLHIRKILIKKFIQSLGARLR